MQLHVEKSRRVIAHETVISCECVRTVPPERLCVKCECESAEQEVKRLTCQCGHTWDIATVFAAAPALAG